MTAPAARLLAAADLLDKRASEATEGPWSASRWDVGSGGVTLLSAVDGSEADATYIATMHPEVGMALAKVLRAEAKRLKQTERLLAFGGAPLFKPEPDTLALADLLLAGAP